MNTNLGHVPDNIQFTSNESKKKEQMQTLTLSDVLRLPKTGIAVIDCETTGLEDDARIIQFAAAFSDSLGQEQGVYKTFLVADGSVGTEETIKVHGLSDEDLIGAPNFDEAVYPIIELLNSRLCFAHFALFDSARMNYELGLIGKSIMKKMGCTKDLCAAAGYGRLRLQEAAKAFGIDAGKAHDAMHDAVTALKVLFYIYEVRQQETLQYIDENKLVWPI